MECKVAPIDTDTDAAMVLDTMDLDTAVVDVWSMLQRRLEGPVDAEEEARNAAASSKQQVVQITEDMLAALVEMVHGSYAGREKLAVSERASERVCSWVGERVCTRVRARVCV